MTEAARLRAWLRSPHGNCYCPPEYRRMAEHVPGCQWIAAIHRVYALERADERSRASAPAS